MLSGFVERRSTAADSVQRGNFAVRGPRSGGVSTSGGSAALSSTAAAAAAAHGRHAAADRGSTLHAAAACRAAARTVAPVVHRHGRVCPIAGIECAAAAKRHKFVYEPPGKLLPTLPLRKAQSRLMSCSCGLWHFDWLPVRCCHSIPVPRQISIDSTLISLADASPVGLHHANGLSCS